MIDSMPSPGLNGYFFTNKILDKFILLLRTLFNAFWLGFLDRNKLHLMSENYFLNTRNYCDDKWNSSGFFEWEKDAIENYFKGTKTLLLVGAGGGREVLALNLLGFQVEGFECNLRLIDYANEFLNKRGIAGNVRFCQYDDCPTSDEKYDGAIIGWAAYMHIQGRAQRILFLKKLKDCLKQNSPILLSFFCMNSKFRLKLIAKLGGLIRFILFGEPLETGDDIFNHVYVHYFTRDQINQELEEAGFKLEYYSELPYGHCIGYVGR